MHGKEKYCITDELLLLNGLFISLSVLPIQKNYHEKFLIYYINLYAPIVCILQY